MRDIWAEAGTLLATDRVTPLLSSSDEIWNAVGTRDTVSNLITCHLMQRRPLNEQTRFCPSKALLGEEGTGTTSGTLRRWPAAGS